MLRIKPNRWVIFGILALTSLTGGARFAAGAEGPRPPAQLRCEYLTDPLGIDVPQPRLYWVLDHSQRGERQTAYQVLVSSRLESLHQDQGDQWDSGQVISGESTQIVYPGKPLESGHTYYWKVRYWDNEKQPSDYSAPARFEMGLLSRQEWNGQWITGNQLRREFRLDGKVARARVYVTALGYYELRINGERIGDRMLDPAWTTYPKRVLYSTYDVTSALTAGQNALGVTLGGGWATLGQGMANQKPYYSQPALLLQMNIELQGGKRISLSSDGAWKSRPRPHYQQQRVRR